MLLLADKLSMKRGERTLFSSLSFQIKAGEVWVITGPSGCGKSTLLQLLTGQTIPTSGQVSRGGLQAELPQDLGINDCLSVSQNAILGSLKGLSLWDSILRYCRGNLRISPQSWGLERSEQKASELSGGEKQRLALVRVLNEKWNLLLADEPIAHLDDANAERLLSTLVEEVKTRNGALVLVLHQESYTKKFGTHRIHLDEGRVEVL